MSYFSGVLAGHLLTHSCTFGFQYGSSTKYIVPHFLHPPPFSKSAGNSGGHLTTHYEPSLLSSSSSLSLGHATQFVPFQIGLSPGSSLQFLHYLYIYTRSSSRGVSVGHSETHSWVLEFQIAFSSPKASAQVWNL